MSEFAELKKTRDADNRLQTNGELLYYFKHQNPEMQIMSAAIAHQAVLQSLAEAKWVHTHTWPFVAYHLLVFLSTHNCNIIIKT